MRQPQKPLSISEALQLRQQQIANSFKQSASDDTFSKALGYNGELDDIEKGGKPIGTISHRANGTWVKHAEGWVHQDTGGKYHFWKDDQKHEAKDHHIDFHKKNTGGDKTELTKDEADSIYNNLYSFTTGSFMNGVSSMSHVKELVKRELDKIPYSDVKAKINEALDKLNSVESYGNNPKVAFGNTLMDGLRLLRDKVGTNKVITRISESPNTLMNSGSKKDVDIDSMRAEDIGNMFRKELSEIKEGDKDAFIKKWDAISEKLPKKIFAGTNNFQQTKKNNLASDIFRTITELREESKKPKTTEAKEITPQKVLAALKKTAIRYESGYHGNSSTGAQPDELHFRTWSSSKTKFHSNEEARVKEELDKIGADYRINGTDVFVKKTPKQSTDKKQSEASSSITEPGEYKFGDTVVKIEKDGDGYDAQIKNSRGSYEYFTNNGGMNSQVYSTKKIGTLVSKLESLFGESSSVAKKEDKQQIKGTHQSKENFLFPARVGGTLNGGGGTPKYVPIKAGDDISLSSQDGSLGTMWYLTNNTTGESGKYMETSYKSTWLSYLDKVKK